LLCVAAAAAAAAAAAGTAARPHLLEDIRVGHNDTQVHIHW
jgi:hypothetical protein